MSETDSTQATTKAADRGEAGMMVVGVFTNPDVLVHHHKTLADSINGNQQILAAAGELGAVAVCSKKSGLTRQLLLGPMQVAPMEYNHKDWQSATQGFKHLPDMVLKKKPKVVIVISEEGRLLLNVLRTILGNNRVGDAVVRRYADFVSEALAGDIYIVNPDSFAAGSEAMDGFERVYALDEALKEKKAGKAEKPESEE